MPTETLPRLSPDVLREIFLYIAPPKSRSSHRIPLDLFASSLVCKDWYIEACALLDRYTFQPLSLDSQYTSDELRRIADLFVEYRRNRLDYLKIETVFVDVVSLTANNLSMPAVQTILAHLPPRTTNLSMAPTSIADIISLSSYRRQRHDIHFLSIITRVHLHNNSGLSLTRQNHINDAIASLSLRLELLKLVDVTFNDHTHAALRLCTALRKVEFGVVSGDDLSSVVQSWPELRSFHYAYNTNSRIMSTIPVPVRSCLQLESFTIIATHIHPDPIVYHDDLLQLPTFAPMLTRIHVACNSSVTDDAMKAIMTIKAPRLEL